MICGGWWGVGGGRELVCMDAREGVSSCAGVCVSACLSVFQVLAVHPVFRLLQKGFALSDCFLFKDE